MYCHTYVEPGSVLLIIIFQLCTRGRIHIFKYLEIEAIKEDRKRDILEGGDCRRLPRKPSTLPDSRFSVNDPRRKRYTIDNTNGFGGYNNSNNKQPVVVDGLDMRWPQQSNHQSDGNPSTTETAPSFVPALLSHSQPVKVLFFRFSSRIVIFYLYSFPYSLKMNTMTNKATKKDEELPEKS